MQKQQASAAKQRERESKQTKAILEQSWRRLRSHSSAHFFLSSPSKQLPGAACLCVPQRFVCLELLELVCRPEEKLEKKLAHCCLLLLFVVVVLAQWAVCFSSS